MAKGLITAELTGLDEFIASIKAIPVVVDKAIEAGGIAMMKQSEKDVRKAYYAVGGKQGDYIDRSISHYGTATPSGKLDGLSYWTSVGVFKLDAVYSSYQNSKGYTKGQKAMTAPQIAYWIENGTSRLRSGARKPKDFVAEAFSPEDIISTVPRPFVSTAFTSGWNRQLESFKVAFNNKVAELT